MLQPAALHPRLFTPFQTARREASASRRKGCKVLGRARPGCRDGVEAWKLLVPFRAGCEPFPAAPWPAGMSSPSLAAHSRSLQAAGGSLAPCDGFLPAVSPEPLDAAGATSASSYQLPGQGGRCTDGGAAVTLRSTAPLWESSSWPGPRGQGCSRLLGLAVGPRLTQRRHTGPWPSPASAPELPRTLLGHLDKASCVLGLVPGSSRSLKWGFCTKESCPDQCRQGPVSRVDTAARSRAVHGAAPSAGMGQGPPARSSVLFSRELGALNMCPRCRAANLGVPSPQELRELGGHCRGARHPGVPHPRGMQGARGEGQQVQEP